MLQNLKRHKILTGLLVILIIAGGYLAYKKFKNNTVETRYVLFAVEKGTLITSVSGTGQVSALNQIDIKSKVSGDAIYLGVKNGQKVQAGTLILQLNAQDAQKSVRDAEANLESAKLSLEKLEQPADALSIMQSENSLAQAKESKTNTQEDLVKTYDNGFNTISNVFLDLPAIMTGLNDIIFGMGLNKNQTNLSYYADSIVAYDTKVLLYKNETEIDYQKARQDYDQNFQDYKSLSRFSAPAQIEAAINQTYETTKNIAEAIKSTINLIQFYKDKLNDHSLTAQSLADTHLASLNTYTSKTNSHLLNLLSIKSSIENDKQAIINADRSIAEKTESLANLKAGIDPLDLQSQNLSIKQKENALLDAKQKLADYFIRAPFAGVVTGLNVKKGDAVSSSTAIATLITEQQIAEISLNEIDVAKVKIKQKATITFDAINGLSMSGEVADIDAIGTVSQGVVTYNIKISFDTQDERVKPGMSVSVAVITEAKQDVLLVPNSAVKTQSNRSYVEIIDNPSSSVQGVQGVTSATAPRQQIVETGISNDSSTEIISGLKEGNQVITQTITIGTASTSTTQSQSSGALHIPGLGGGGFGR